MRKSNGNHFEIDRCPHNHEAIRELAIKKKKMIFSAKLDYEDPAGLKTSKITPTEK